MPVILKLIEVYKLWQAYLILFPKTSRYSLGNKIDVLFTEIIESTSTAIFLNKEEKIPYIRKSIVKLDTLKIFLQIAWEIDALDKKRYVAISTPLLEIGRMLGGWYGQLKKQNSPASVFKK